MAITLILDDSFSKSLKLILERNSDHFVYDPTLSGGTGGFRAPNIGTVNATYLPATESTTTAGRFSRVLPALADGAYTANWFNEVNLLRANTAFGVIGNELAPDSGGGPGIPYPIPVSLPIQGQELGAGHSGGIGCQSSTGNRLQIIKGNTIPDRSIQFVDADKRPVSLAGATSVMYQLAKANGDVVVGPIAASIEPGSQGIARYDWQPGDTDTAYYSLRETWTATFPPLDDGDEPRVLTVVGPLVSIRQ